MDDLLVSENGRQHPDLVCKWADAIGTSGIIVSIILNIILLQMVSSCSGSQWLACLGCVHKCVCIGGNREAPFFRQRSKVELGGARRRWYNAPVLLR